jgi:hypothetical protein
VPRRRCKPVSRRFYVVQFRSREHERITTLDAIIQTLTLAIVLLIIGMACVVIGIAGLVWINARNSRRRDGAVPASTSGAFFSPTSARSRHGSGHATRGAGRADAREVVSSRLSGHP